MSVRERIRQRLQKIDKKVRRVQLPEEVILGLGPKQRYPEGAALSPAFLRGRAQGVLSRQTPVASIGSCFAREIKDYLQESGFDYIVTADGPNARPGSAAWDRVYNTFCLRQEVARALGEFAPQERLWQLGDGSFLAPYRKDVQWDSRREAEEGLEEHRRSAREAFLAARVLVMTVGLTEVWYSKDDGSVFFQVPPADVYDPEKHGFRVSSYQENLDNLEEMLRLLTAANPDCTLIVTVSPVPLRATFQDENGFVANARSKSTLVAATREFVDRHPGVRYFPSYELVTQVIPEPFAADNRHVKRTTVQQIMAVFEANFMSEEARTPDPS